ncbi:YqzK family protein [Bacillus taeanensis]|nr:YqzK family protein [Bacillus taeanensis]
MAKLMRMMVDTIKVFLIFMACTLFFYFSLVWLNEEYQNYHRYDEPEGKSIKVSGMLQTTSNTTINMVDRLILFYREGE